MAANAEPNIELRDQSSKLVDNESTLNVEHSSTPIPNVVMGNPSKEAGHANLVTLGDLEVSRIPTSFVNASSDPGNVAQPGDKPDETTQNANIDPGDTEQASNETLEKDSSAKEQHLEQGSSGNPSNSSTGTNDVQRVQIISNELVTIRELPRHSKPFKKRSLSVDLSRELPEISGLTKKPKQDPVQQVNQNASTSYVKLTPLEENIRVHISKVKSGPKPEYTIKNSCTNTATPVSSTPKRVSLAELDTLSEYEALCQRIIVINNQAKTLSNKFKELTTSFDENATSCDKIHSLVDDLVTLYSDDFNVDYSESDSDYDSDDESQSDDDDDQHDIPQSTSKPIVKFTRRINSRNRDTRWTLNYQQKEFDNTELVKGSGIYVSKTGLVKCRNLAKSGTSLASLLMTEIFTKKALLKCSYSGMALKINEAARPPLDPNGIMALLNFVRQFSEESDWEIKTNETLRKHINAYLCVFRKRNRM